jgi:hypothetical protein
MIPVMFMAKMPKNIAARIGRYFRPSRSPRISSTIWIRTKSRPSSAML